MERPFALRELLLTTEGQEILRSDEFSGVNRHNRRNSKGAAIALDIQRNFKFPGDKDTKPEDIEK
ncbi:hypothetical protein K2P47_02405 [Patescibacteria group bacterium]|nr:hypothetical protein [Patescibacteria group bacterium]